MLNKRYNNKRKSLVWREISTKLVGLRIVIKKSNSPELEGVRGIIEDETYNLLKIKINKKVIKVQKRNNIFELELIDNSKILIDGNSLLGTPDVRIKKRFSNW
jgi:ribonuclease P protein subunit POP4